MSTLSHSIISPAILYWGTPIVLVTTENEDGTSNIACISSAFWLGRSCILGLGAKNKTTDNLLRSGECVLNLADETMVAHVNALADTTGSQIVPVAKQARNYKYVADKWKKANLTAESSEFVRPKRIVQCQVQMECQLLQNHKCRPDAPDLHGGAIVFEVRVLRIYVVDALRLKGYANRIDPDKWRPLFMSFQELYGIGSGKAGESVLGRVSEERYRAFTRSQITELPGDDDFTAESTIESKPSSSTC